MRFKVLVLLALHIAHNCSAQTITIVSSSTSVEVPLSLIATDEDNQMFDGWDYGSDDAEVDLQNVYAEDADLGFIDLALLATAKSFVDPVLPSAQLACEIDVTYHWGGILTSGWVSYSASTESSATLQLDGASPLDILDVRVTVLGNAEALGGGLHWGYYGFEYEDDYFDAIIYGPWAYSFYDVDNTMDFYFDGVAALDASLLQEFYVELPSGSQIDVLSYAAVSGSTIEYTSNSTGGGSIGEHVYATGVLWVDIMP